MPASVGLCARCASARVARSARGSRFWRCARADADPAFPRYPALPVLRCPGFQEGDKLVGAGNGLAREPGGGRGGR